MPDCQSIDPLVTPYVDGELDSANRERLEHHLRACPPCYSRVQAERAVRNLLQQRQPLFRGECAPAVLRARCAAYRPVASLSGATATAWRRRAAPFAAAAALVLVVGGAFLYQATARSSRVLAAELADLDPVT